MSAGLRPRTYDAATIRRWTSAIEAGVTGAEFRSAFGLTLTAARKAAARHGVQMPSCAEVGFGGRTLRDLKAPQGRFKA